MALSFHATTAPLFCQRPAADMSFLQDVHPEVTDALLGFVYDPLDPSNFALDELLDLPLHDDAPAAAFLEPVVYADTDVGIERRCAKKHRACGDDDAWRGLVDIDAASPQRNGGRNQHAPALPELLNKFILPLPTPPPQLPEPVAFVRVADANKTTGSVSQTVQSAAARQRRKRISEKTAELSWLIPGAHKLNTAEMLEEAVHHVKFLQAQVGILALMVAETEKMPSMTQEQQMHALLMRGGVQERLAAEGKCLVPRKLVEVVAKEKSIKSNALVNRDLGRFMESLPGQ